MNTDNFSILSQTIDYGPFQFLDVYDPEYICNHSDEMGRYAFMEQPSVALWNLVRLATALAPLLATETTGDETVAVLAKPLLDAFVPTLRSRYNELMCAKFGFSSASPLLIKEVVEPMLVLMHQAKMDYTLFMRALAETPLATEQLQPETWEQWRSCSYSSPSELTTIDDESESGTSLETQFHLWFIQWRTMHS
ncbi:hypothetical protein HDU91_003607, partial [Kappamyces sp. JEL0680]